MNFNFIYFIVAVFGISFAVAPAEAPAAVAVQPLSEESSSAVCSNASDSFSQDESQVLAAEYSKSGTADCLFVGCGGII